VPPVSKEWLKRKNPSGDSLYHQFDVDRHERHAVARSQARLGAVRRADEPGTRRGRYRRFTKVENLDRDRKAQWQDVRKDA
jgi:hypothetical protein